MKPSLIIASNLLFLVMTVLRVGFLVTHQTFTISHFLFLSFMDGRCEGVRADVGDKELPLGNSKVVRHDVPLNKLLVRGSLIIIGESFRQEGLWQMKHSRSNPSKHYLFERTIVVIIIHFHDTRRYGHLDAYLVQGPTDFTATGIHFKNLSPFQQSTSVGVRDFSIFDDHSVVPVV